MKFKTKLFIGKSGGGLRLAANLIVCRRAKNILATPLNIRQIFGAPVVSSKQHNMSGKWNAECGVCH